MGQIKIEKLSVFMSPVKFEHYLAIDQPLNPFSYGTEIKITYV